MTRILRALLAVLAVALFYCAAAQAQVSPQGSGTPSFSTFDSHGIDSVNLLNNNIVISISAYGKSGLFPVQTYWTGQYYAGIASGEWYINTGVGQNRSGAGIAGSGPGLVAMFNGAGGMYGSTSYTGIWWTTIAVGFSTSTGYSCPGSGAGTKYSGLYVITPDGTSHLLPASDSVVSSAVSGCVTTVTDVFADNSGFTVTVTGAPLLTEGPLVASLTDSSGMSYSTYPASFPGLKDSNGNTITASGGSGPSNPLTITDTWGVSDLQMTPATVPAVTGTTASISWTNGNGTTSNSTLAYGISKYYATNFGCSGIVDYTATSTSYMPSTLTKGDGRAVSFTYEQTPSKSSSYVTGRIAGITYPEGGTATYTYSGGSNGINCTYQTVPTLTRTQGNGDITTYSLSYATTTGSNRNAVNTVIDPGGNETDYTFSGLNASGVQSWPVAQVLTQVEKFKGTGTTKTLLTTDVYSYNTSYTSSPSISTIVQAVTSFPITTTITYHQIAGMTKWSAHQQTFDAHGNVLTDASYDFGAISPTFQTTYTYGSCTSTTNCATTSPTISNTAMAANNIYNKMGQVVTQQNGTTVAQSNYIYDQYGNLDYSYVWTGTGTSMLGQASSNVYNPNGTIQTAYDLNNNSTGYLYQAIGYSDGCKGVYPFPTKVTDPVGLSTTATYDCTGGVELSLSDANSNKTTFAYADAYWRRTSLADPYSATIYYTFPTSVSPDTSASSFSFSSSILATTNTVDGYGRFINSQGDQSPTGTTYDTVSNAYAWQTSGTYNNYFQIQSSQPCSAASGTQCSFQHAAYFDPLGRTYVSTTTSNETVTNTFSNSGSTSPYTYYVLSALTPAPSGENAKQTQAGYNGLGQLTSICHIGSTASTGSATACPSGSYNGAVDAYTYSQGTGYREVYVTRSGTQQRTNYYDAMGRLYQKVTPEGGTWNYTYDTPCSSSYLNTTGRLAKSVDPNVNTICYSYDALGRVTLENANGTTCRHYYYDTTYGTLPTGVSPPTNTLGRIAEASTDNCSGTLITDEWFSYDEDGRPLNLYQSSPHSTQYYNSAATFYDNGNISSIHLANPSGYTVDYGIDGEGRWNTFDYTPLSLTAISATTYNAAGQPTNIQLTGSTPDQDIYTYDSNTGNMLTFEFEVGNTPANLTGTLTWNPNGTLAKLAEVDGFNSGGSETCYSNSSSSLGYGYDDWARLMTFDCGSGNWGQNYTYDMYDNLSKAVISGRTGTTWNPGYSSTTNHYSIGSYDSNGNVTSDGNNAYTWNEFSKLKSTANGGGSVTCGTTGNCAIYDAFGRMVEMSNGSTWTELWQLQTGTTVNMSGSTQNYSYLPAGGGGTVEVTGSGVVYYLHKDWLGNARVISYVNGHNVGEDRAYTPYGEIYNNFFASGPKTAEFAGIPDDFNPGVEWSTPNRELSTVGRWLSPDPAGFGWNQYAYVTNPNSFGDPSGLAPPVACMAAHPMGQGGGCEGGHTPYGGGGIDALSGWFSNFDQPPTNLFGTVLSDWTRGSFNEYNWDGSWLSTDLWSHTLWKILAEPIDGDPPMGAGLDGSGGVTMKQILNRAKNRALQLLNNTKCKAFYGGRGAKVLQETHYVDRPASAHPKSPGWAAVVDGGIYVDLNAQGSFYHAASAPIPVSFGDPVTLSGADLGAFILLHELAHQMEGITGAVPDGEGDGPDQLFNNQLVIDHCFPQ
jgi:YD repeat-containing protein